MQEIALNGRIKLVQEALLVSPIINKFRNLSVKVLCVNLFSPPHIFGENTSKWGTPRYQL